jgi:hypothetical protein
MSGRQIVERRGSSVDRHYMALGKVHVELHRLQRRVSEETLETECITAGPQEADGERVVGPPSGQQVVV